MPIYEYQCRECKHQFETIRKVSDEPLTVCPACGRPALKKLISKAAFRLKGGGWYETDFKSKGKKNVAGDHGGESKSEHASESGESKSDTAGSDKKAKDEKKSTGDASGGSDSSAKSGAAKSAKKSSESAAPSKTKSPD